MKRMLFLFLAIGLFASCNNTAKGLTEKEDRKTDKRDKEDRNDDEDRNRDDEDNRGGSWSKKDRTKFLNDCEGGFDGQGYSTSQAKQICDCVLEKLESRYSSLREADEKGGEAAGQKAAMACMGGGGFQGDDGGGNDDN